MRMTRYSLFTVFKPLLASVTFLFLRLKCLCLPSGVFPSSPSQPVVLRWSHAKPVSILFGQGTADNARVCNQASSCLHASSSLQELNWDCKSPGTDHERCTLKSMFYHWLAGQPWANKAEQQPLGAPIFHRVQWETDISYFGGTLPSLHGNWTNSSKRGALRG